MPELYPKNDIALSEELYARRSDLETILTTVPQNKHAIYILAYWAALGGLAATGNPVQAIYVKSPGYDRVPVEYNDACPDLLMELDEEDTLSPLKALPNGAGRKASALLSTPSKKRKVRHSSDMDTDSDYYESEHPKPCTPQYHLPLKADSTIRTFNGGYLPEEIEMARCNDLRGSNGFLALDDTLRYTSAW